MTIWKNHHAYTLLTYNNVFSFCWCWLALYNVTTFVPPRCLYKSPRWFWCSRRQNVPVGERGRVAATTLTRIIKNNSCTLNIGKAGLSFNPRNMTLQYLSCMRKSTLNNESPMPFMCRKERWTNHSWQHAWRGKRWWQSIWSANCLQCVTTWIYYLPRLQHGTVKLIHESLLLTNV